MALTDTLERNAVSKINGRNQSVSLVPGGKKVNGTFVPNLSADNRTTNRMVDQGQLPESQRETFPQLPAPTFTPTNTIDASALSQPALQTPTPTASEFADFENFLRQATPSDDPLTQERSTLTAQIRDRIRAIGQKGARQTELEAEAGLPEQRVELQNTMEQIARLRESFNTAIVNEEGVARPQEFITGRQAFLEKQKAVQLDALGAVSAALQGNIALAEKAAQDAVDREFADEEAELEELYFAYNTNKDNLERNDKKAADQLANYINERARILTNNKEERNAVIALAQEAALNGAPADLVSRITQMQSQEEAMSLAGSYIGALDRAAKLQSISTSRTNQLLVLAEAGDPGSIAALGFDPRSVQEEVDPVTRRQLESEVDGTTELIDLATQYRDLIEQHGYTNTIAGDPTVLGQIEGLRAAITASYKKAATLGTLDNGVLTLMEKLLGETPTSTFNPTKNLTGRPAQKLVSSLDTFIETAQNAKARASLRLGLNPVAMDVLQEDDLAEIDALLGSDAAAAEFNPANYY